MQISTLAAPHPFAAFCGTATGYVDVNRPAAPRRAANATGDSIVTDGIMTVVQVGSGKTAAAGLRS
jgi:hypothetical protein